MAYLLNSKPRPLRVCYINYDSRLVDESLESIENELEKVHAFEMVEIESVESKDFQPCDMLILLAHSATRDQLVPWVKGLAKRLETHIWTPALIIGDLGMLGAKNLVSFAVESNWYFDVINTSDLSSLSLRVANLIRIHDHLHELFRYEETILDLEKKLTALESKVKFYIQRKNSSS
ncbi:MAG: hypothetical protein OXC44_04630 [Proteobacteria bacterium]|nr:hypothetical protein [Pseudomonadota bacterium]